MQAPAEIPRRKLTGKDVSAMVAAGTLGERERVALIAGELIVTPHEGPLHASLVGSIADTLRAAYPADRYTVREGHPLVLDDLSEPQPDLVVATAPREGYRDRHPTGPEALLVIEVAHTSLKLDRAMAELYARAGVLNYWIVDVKGRVAELHSQPRPSGLWEVRIVGDRLLLPTTDVTLSLHSLLP